MVQEQMRVEAARRGDVEAFNELVLLYQDRVYTVAYRIMQDTAAADDITQETFVTAFRKLDQFRGGNFAAWLMRIATNASYDELRRRKRRRTDSLDDGEIDEEADSRLASDTANPERFAQHAELKSAIEYCFEQLADAYRIVVTMSDIEEYSYEEIAGIVNVSLGTVKSRISRARAQLRDCLRANGELLPAAFRSSNE
jgi:RNA polymerase sigma-70 factor (ECF subfamily)